MRKYRFASLVLAFMLVFGVGMFANCDRVYASIGSDSYGFDYGDETFRSIFRFGSEDDYYDISVTIDPTSLVHIVALDTVNCASNGFRCLYLYAVSSSRFTPTVSRLDNGYTYPVTVSKYGSIYVCQLYSIAGFDGNLDYPLLCPVGNFSNGYTDSYIPFFMDLFYEGSNDSVYTIVSPPPSSFDSDSAQYSSDLGHLENVTVKQLDTDNDNQIDCFRFAWNRRTSTGVDLDERGYDVEYWYEMKYSYTDIFGKQHDYFGQTDKLYISDKSDHRSAVYEYSTRASKFWDLYMEVFTNTTFSPMKTLEKKITFYVRPIYFDGENSYYGDLTTVNIDPKIDSIDYDVTTDNGDGTTSSSSGSTSTGRGDSLEEALDNSVVHDPSVDIGDSDVSGVLSNFTDSVKSFQILFTTFLSFMPSWVLAFLIACIVIWCIMIVKKSILG